MNTLVILVVAVAVMLFIFLMESNIMLPLFNPSVNIFDLEIIDDINKLYKSYADAIETDVDLQNTITELHKKINELIAKNNPAYDIDIYINQKVMEMLQEPEQEPYPDKIKGRKVLMTRREIREESKARKTL